MPRAAVTTPQRILDAAVLEFSERGLAGARVDRIAERAGANKQRIYAYFGGKDELFDRVVEERIGDLLDAVPFAADDLPGYAVRLFDHVRAHPELVRLLLWHSLERPGRLAQLPQSSGSTAVKVAALREVQERHPERVDPTVPAERLLVQVLAVANGLALGLGEEESGSPERGGAAAEELRGDLRRSVARMIAPAL